MLKVVKAGRLQEVGRDYKAIWLQAHLCERGGARWDMSHPLYLPFLALLYGEEAG